MKGAVATGHVETTRAAIEILEEGGNAADAALTALTCSAACENYLTSFFGGGFMLWVPANGKPIVYDFFTQTPCQRRERSELDFKPALATFGTESQTYHLGWGTVAVPGQVKGFFEIHKDLCTIPIKRIFSPTQRICREGFIVNDMQDFLYKIVRPFFDATESSRKIHKNKETGDFYKAGETFRNTDFADFLDVLAAEGEELLYKGELGKTLCTMMRENGGYLTEKDFTSYKVIKRSPLETHFGDIELLGCPPPSITGLSLRLILNLLKSFDYKKIKFRSAEYYLLLVRLLEVLEKARKNELDNHLMDIDPDTFWRSGDEIASYQDEIKNFKNPLGSTTHISVIDKDGNMASITTSCGETAGIIAPNTGIFLNNMLGEEDINPKGFHNFDLNERLPSSMSPSAAISKDGSKLALGSAGSNRIRSAMLQSFLNIFEHGLSVEKAVCESRLHYENGHVSLEGGINPEAESLIKDQGYSVKSWDELNLFFGGAHAAYYSAADKSYSAASDPRRHGHAAVAVEEK